MRPNPQILHVSTIEGHDQLLDAAHPVATDGFIGINSLQERTGRGPI